MIPRSRTVSLLALGAICLTGCSTEVSTEPKLKPLTLKEQVSHVAKSSDGYVVNWAGVLANDNPWHFGEHVVATIVGRDAGGREVVRMDQPLDAVPPGGELAFTGHANAEHKPVKVSIEYRPAQWRTAARVPSAFRPFPVTRVQTLPQKDGSVVVTGYVGNPYRLPAGSLVVNALVRDRDGKLLGGGSTFVDDVKPGRTPRFVLTVEGLPSKAKPTDAEVSARTWGSTARPYEELALGGAVPLHTIKPSMPPFAVDRGSSALTEHKE